MSLQRMSEFTRAYGQYRRDKNSPADGLVALATFAVVVCALIGGYVVQKTGNDANAYSIGSIVIAVPLFCWYLIDMRRFAKQRTT